MLFEEKEKYSMDDLVFIVKLLRSPNGCPWDKAQTHESIRRNFLEETYEAVEAIDNCDSNLLKEELGDVLLQVVFHANMEEEVGRFTFDDVCDLICKKLVYRHPHVFGDKPAEDSNQALMNWEQMKRLEKDQRTASDTLNQVSKALPALIYSEKVQSRAAKVGFDYDETTQVLQHLESEIVELKEAMQKNDLASIHDEFGDVLFSCVNLSRFLSVDAEKSLYDSAKKFIARFEKMETIAMNSGIELKGLCLDELNALWDEAKKDI